MTLTNYSGTTYPTASISINKNKLRSYNGNFYLQDGQEFEIELFNPTEKTILAKLIMNGKSISTSGIVLKPGQRVYLERFLDTPKRFAFETYNIDATDSQAVAAIANNGSIVVDFYNEKELEYFYNHPFSGTITYTSNGIGTTCNTFYNTGGNTRSLVSSEAATTKTGRVEQGSLSNQHFTNYSGEFNNWISTTVHIKLLPYSAKPLEVQDLAQYCTNCGTRNKGGNYKYCPKCGTKFN